MVPQGTPSGRKMRSECPRVVLISWMTMLRRGENPKETVWEVPSHMEVGTLNPTTVCPCTELKIES